MDSLIDRMLDLGITVPKSRSKNVELG